MCAFCTDCRILERSKENWKDSCTGCLKVIANAVPPIQEENKRLREENNSLPSLREENKRLKIEIRS